MTELSRNPGSPVAHCGATVTVAVVTASLRNAHAQKCIDDLKRHTENYDLWILDNNNSSNFNHSREINKVLTSVNSDYVVLMDDDVFVEAEWLPNLLRAMDDKTGLVAPLHRDGNGLFSFSGVYLMGDDFGTHAHLLDMPPAPRVSQCVCGALLLIDRRKCGDLRFSEDYNKYWIDIDYSLQVWDAGYEVVCTPDVTVTHVGGGTTARESRRSREYWNAELPVFVRSWIATGRLARVQAEIWSRYPELQRQCEIPRRIRQITENSFPGEAAEFEAELHDCFELSAPYPQFRSLLSTGLRRQIRRPGQLNDGAKIEVCRQMIRQLAGTEVQRGGPSPELLETRSGYNLIEFGQEFLGIPVDLGPVDVYEPESRDLPGLLFADSFAALCALVDARPRKSAPSPKLIETQPHYNLVEFGGTFFAIPLSLGIVDVGASATKDLPVVLMAASLPELRTQVELRPVRKPRPAPPPHLLRRAAGRAKHLVKDCLHVAADLLPHRPSGVIPCALVSFHPAELVHPIWAREKYNDLAVFDQIFNAAEYACVDDLQHVGLVVDCGASAGYFSAYCLSRFPGCQVVAVEPDEGNFEMLKRNVSPYGNRARLIHAGVWSHPARLALSEHASRDGREWTRQVRECRPAEKSQFAGIDLATLLAQSGQPRISILKVALAGAEGVIFSANVQSWIGQVDTIVIELHDESQFGKASQAFHSAIQGRGFEVSKFGQITVCTIAPSAKILTQSSTQFAAAPSRRRAA